MRQEVDGAAMKDLIFDIDKFNIEKFNDGLKLNAFILSVRRRIRSVHAADEARDLDAGASVNSLFERHCPENSGAGSWSKGAEQMNDIEIELETEITVKFQKLHYERRMEQRRKLDRELSCMTADLEVPGDQIERAVEKILGWI